MHEGWIERALMLRVTESVLHDSLPQRQSLTWGQSLGVSSGGRASEWVLERGGELEPHFYRSGSGSDILWHTFSLPTISRVI